MLCFVLDPLKYACPEMTAKSVLTRVSITARLGKVLKMISLPVKAPGFAKNLSLVTVKPVPTWQSGAKT